MPEAWDMIILQWHLPFPATHPSTHRPPSNKYSVTLPTFVDPVKEIFLTMGFSHSSFPTAGALARDAVTTFSTPAGRPASLASFKNNHKTQLASKNLKQNDC